ncbi:putative zinc-binding peptidase [Rhizobium sp. CFBP 8762]|uniref:zinc-binding metallopeptidase family protein n=1 Tax=Rhizobium sp. CFBP 8762 TaxID=2775279 RepID=UPI001782355F|nr:putative zinc-binding peptidase [Rhizobium sp. CFBP 8762]MBD8553246.1 putative zinc-binding peptidase [Rhizobium sp. CFBP 8762]
MKLFTCDSCGHAVHFDNRGCVTCGHRLGFNTETLAVHALEPLNDLEWRIHTQPDKAWKFCANAAFDICNWLVPAQSGDPYCIACHHNRIVPVTNTPEGLSRWQRIGQAQRHLFYSLLRWKLPRPTRADDPQGGLVFDFLADEIGPDGNPVPAMTGHEDGLISLRAAEADDATRESIRVAMNEPYRTLLGHFRHEIGHFYWTQLVRDDETLAEARRIFGDERADYAQALQRNYEQGPPADWQERFISTYASCHPAEDFAETWAHNFHIVDTLETARSFGLTVDPVRHDDMQAEVDFDPYNVSDSKRLIDAWVPLSVALNSIQRSMGQPDSYPFVLNQPVMEKLDFINRLIYRAGH